MFTKCYLFEKNDCNKNPTAIKIKKVKSIHFQSQIRPTQPNTSSRLRAAQKQPFNPGNVNRKVVAQPKLTPVINMAWAAFVTVNWPPKGFSQEMNQAIDADPLPVCANRVDQFEMRVFRVKFNLCAIGCGWVGMWGKGDIF